MPQQEPENPGDRGGGDEGLPAKSSAPPPPPGGGPGSGPGGGFGGGFGGLAGGGAGGRRPALFRGLPGIGESSLPVLLRRRGLNVPGITPGPPGRGDTVPAMLSPGEIVMNNGVTQDPQMAAQLLQMNQQAIPQQGYEDGGMVPEVGAGGRPSRAIRILQLLLELDDFDNGVQGFAAGGMAMGNPFASRLGQMRGGGLLGGLQRGGAQPGGILGGVRGPAAGPAAGLNPTTGQFSTLTPGQGGAWADPSGTVRDASGNVRSYDPKNPWGSYTGSYNPGAQGIGERIIGAAGAGGAFDPRGNQALINAQIEGAQGTKDSLVRRGMTAADLAGLDPAAAAAAKLQTLRDTGRGVQDISAQVRARGAESQDAFIKSLLAGQLGQQNAAYLQQQGAFLADEMANKQNERNKKGQWGNIAGGVLGAGIGGWAGGGFKGPGG